MITDNSYFSTDLDKINVLVTDYDKQVHLLRKTSIYNFSRENLQKRYENIFSCFPWEIEDASDLIAMSIYTTELFNLAYKENIKIEEINESKQRFKDKQFNDDYRYEIIDFLDDLFHNLTYSYDRVINATKQLHFFTGIEDESIILMNLLKLYKSVLKDKERQLMIFWGVCLTKEISDMVTKMLIDFIEQRLIVLNPKIELENIDIRTTFIKNDSKTIDWLGTQQDLCELFIELIDKKWIPEIQEGTKNQFVNSILNVFDLSKTQRKKYSNPKKSFYQQFKGEIIDGKRYFKFLESSSYERKFNNIVKNNR